MKYIVVTGGVMSGVGKGIASSSLGILLKSRGHSVTHIKVDPYFNIDAGTISPYDHGEVYVLKDGGECDLDLGSYERFLDITLTKHHNITSGKIFKKVIEKERKGDYLGKTVQLIPHVTGQIIESIKKAALIPVDKDGSIPNMCIIELGGTVGDLESNIFVEALKRLKFEKQEDFMTIHVSMVISSGEEQKTKPVQKSVEEIRRLGLTPDILICRNKNMITQETRKKLSVFCSIYENYILSVKNCNSVYHVPELLESQNIYGITCAKLNISRQENSNPHYKRLLEFTRKMENPVEKIKIALVGKYTKVDDSYLSVVKALEHACTHNQIKLEIIKVDSEDLEKYFYIEDVDAIIVPGGFGSRGTNGIIKAIHYARVNNIPFLGICYGFQLAVVEFLRNEFYIDTTTSEIEKTENNCIDIIPTESGDLGGTMNLGLHKSILTDERIKSIYKSDEINERCRHRYELVPDYIPTLESKNMNIAGIDSESGRATILNLTSNRFFVATQFHPEFQTRLYEPHPLFQEFVRACIN